VIHGQLKLTERQCFQHSLIKTMHCPVHPDILRQLFRQSVDANVWLLK